MDSVSQRVAARHRDVGTTAHAGLAGLNLHMSRLGLQ
jgi:hypothetical protein